MIEHWEWICIRLGDALWGWSLSLPRDLAIVVVGTIVGLVLLFVRAATADRSRLRLIARDESQLRRLIREARQSGDGERLTRYRQVRGLVGMRRLREEWVGWCVSLIILAAFIPWGTRRLEYLPVQPGIPTRFLARFPSSVIGEMVHAVPLEQVKVNDGWLRTVESEVRAGSAHGHADWTFEFDASQKHVLLTIRLRNQTLVHPLSVGTSTYELPMRVHDGGIQTEVGLNPYRPLGFLPARLWVGIPAWSLFLTIVVGAVYFCGVLIPFRRSQAPPTLHTESTRRSPSESHL